MDTNALVKQRQQQLDQIYNPQIDLINQQMQAIPGQFAGQKSALEQAKTNAFRDITQTANRRGMFFSGFQPQEQARYLGERYLPGLQDVDARQTQARLGLMEQLTGLRGKRAETMTSFQEQLRQEQVARRQRQEDYERERQMQRERLANDRNIANIGNRSDSPGGGAKLVKNSRGGWEVTGGDLDLAGYARATGRDLIALLSQGDKKDRQAANWYMEKINKYGTDDADKYFQELMRDRPTAFYRGG